MKKTLLPILFFVAVAFLFPTYSHAESRAVSVTINHLYIPARAGVMLIDDRPNTEFGYDYGAYVSVVDNTGTVIYRRSTNNYKMQKGSVARIVFPYDAGSAPYNVRIEIQASSPWLAPYWNDAYFVSPGCSLLPSSFAGYHTPAQNFYYFSPPGTNNIAWLDCPFNIQYYWNLWFSSGNVYYNSEAGYYYWYSPSILTIQ